MSININLTEKEILDTPNDYDLGEKVRIKYWEEKSKHSRVPKNAAEMMVTGNSDIIESIPSDDEISEWDITLMDGLEDEEFEIDKCVICGMDTPYLKSTHIDLRIGYVEGGGQGCFQPNNCDRV